MDTVYVLLLALTGISFFLGIEWLLLASMFLFVALVFSRYYSGRSSSVGGEIAPDFPQSAGAAASSAPQPIVVVQSGGGAATISDSIIAQMMGQFMAMDAYEKKDQAPQFKFLSRGMKMRQNMFDHHGKVGSHHQAMNREASSAMLSKLDEISRKLDKT